MNMPLSGLLVLDFGRVVAAPRCARLLADLGADVIHIERPDMGDDTRHDPHVFVDGMSGAFIQQNWGKKSLCIDLKHERARDVIHPLVKKADILIENFRPGAMGRLGLGYGQLCALNDRLIMCSISAYGQNGPHADRIGYGYVADAISGIPEITGDPNGPPTPIAVPLSDCAASMLGFGLICAALHERHRTGKGRHIDLSLLEAVFCMHDRSTQLYLATEGREMPTRRGLLDAMLVPWGYFEAADGWLCMLCGTDQQWAALASAMNRPELGTDSRFRTNADRAQNRDVVYDMLKAWVRSFASRDEIVDLLAAHQVPCGSVNDIARAVHDEQVVARKIFVERDHPVLGNVTLHNFLGSSFVGSEPGDPAPLLGQHTRMVACKLAGIDDDAYRSLVASRCLFERAEG